MRNALHHRRKTSISQFIQFNEGSSGIVSLRQGRTNKPSPRLLVFSCEGFSYPTQEISMLKLYFYTISPFLCIHVRSFVLTTDTHLNQSLRLDVLLQCILHSYLHAFPFFFSLLILPPSFSPKRSMWANLGLGNPLNAFCIKSEGLEKTSNLFDKTKIRGSLVC